MASLAASSKMVTAKKTSKGNPCTRARACALCSGIVALILVDSFVFQGGMRICPDVFGIGYIEQIVQSLGVVDLMLALMLMAWPLYKWFNLEAENMNPKKSVSASLPACDSIQNSVRRRSVGSRPEKAANVTEQLNNQNVSLSKCIQAIDQASRDGDAETAGKLLLEYERSGGKPDAVTYNLVLRACAKRSDVWSAEKWLQRMLKVGVEATTCTYNTVLDACAKGDDVDKCEYWLARMIADGVEANVISYATAIYARARLGHQAEAADWFTRMVKAGIQPDSVCYNSLIHACGVNGDPRGAERWFQEMKQRGLEATVTTYTAAIDACAKCRDVSAAERWMERMLAASIKPNVVTFSTLIDACAKCGNLARAEYWHDRLVDTGIKPNAHTYSAVISACAKAGDVDAAERWLLRAEACGITGDVVVYSSMIDACGKVGDAERGMAVFNKMRANGVRPHLIAYAALARPFAYRGDYMEVERIADMMVHEKLQPNDYFVYAQLLAYATAKPRQAARAEACFRSFKQTGAKENDYVIGVLARAVGSARCQELTSELCKGRTTSTTYRRK